MCRSKPIIDFYHTRVPQSSLVAALPWLPTPSGSLNMSAKLSTPKFAVSVAKDLDMLSALVATELVTAAREAIEERGEFWVAVSGGSLPQVRRMPSMLCCAVVRAFTAAAAGQVLMRGLEKVDMSHLEPDKWRVVFADERVVPLDDSESNFRALRAVLVDAVRSWRQRERMPQTNAAACAPSCMYRESASWPFNQSCRQPNVQRSTSNDFGSSWMARCLLHAVGKAGSARSLRNAAREAAGVGAGPGSARHGARWPHGIPVSRPPAAEGVVALGDAHHRLA